MNKKIKTVKSQVTLIMVSFITAVTIMIAIYGLYLLSAYQRSISVQSIEFNLQLVANLIDQDLRDLTSLGKWCGNENSAIIDFMISGETNEKRLGIRAFNRVNEETNNNRSRFYIRRLIIVDNELQKILQIDNYASASRPVNKYNIGLVEGIGGNIISEWKSLVPDALSDSKIIPLIYPVYDPTNRSRIGTVFLAANAALITDKLKGYSLPENAPLFINLGELCYRIEGKDFIPDDFEYESLSRDTVSPISSNTIVTIARSVSGGQFTLVTYPVREGISLTQVLPQRQFSPQSNTWIWLLMGMLFLIVMLAVCVVYYLDRTISQPVAKLRKRINIISNGDFSPDVSIESDDELGQVGKGVNQLSRDLVVLMENRIKDEQQKQELEYRMLQSQISPHFLYNTLNSIKWMATLQGADGIAEMTTSLSRLLKTVSKDVRKVVTLEDELTLLNDYMLIQEYRYGGNITMTKIIHDNSLLKTQIPRFTLQPLVENAIFHGIEPKGSGSIKLEVLREKDTVLVTVTDDGVGMSDDIQRLIFEDTYNSQNIITELGLRNVHERLLYAFGKGYGLSIESKVGEFSKITLRLPCLTWEEN